MKDSIVPLFCFFQSKLGKNTGASFVGSTSLVVCNIKRSLSNKTFKNIAIKGKSTMGWFFGFKLHLIINDFGEIIAWQLTPRNVDYRKAAPKLSEKLKGLLIGDKGYISGSLFHELYDRGVTLITRLRSNMKNKLMPLFDKLLLKKRGLIESVNDQLKNTAHIDHTRHRSVWNFLTNLMSGLIAYSFQQQKPPLNLRKNERAMIMKIY